MKLIERAWNEKSIGALYLLGSYDVQAGDDSYFPIYEICNEKRIPIVFHADFDIGGYFESFVNYAAISALCFPFQLVKHLTGIISEGIFERFPHVNFAFIEGGLSWVPWLISRLDPHFSGEGTRLTLAHQSCPASTWRKDVSLELSPWRTRHPSGD